MGAVLIAAFAAAGSATGLVSLVLSAIRRTAAERRLKKALSRNRDHLRKLEEVEVNLISDPNSVKLQEARQIISSLPGVSDSDKSEILRTLSEGSSRSEANYVAKLLEGQETVRDTSE